MTTESLPSTSSRDLLLENQRAIETAFSYANVSSDIPALLDPDYPFLTEPADGRVEIVPGRFAPVAVELARLLIHLKQRREIDRGKARLLVGRFRAEVRGRTRPLRNIRRDTLVGLEHHLSEIGGRDTYSQFQVDGWRQVDAVMERTEQGQVAAAVITAPTGSGKTEVFILPIMNRIAAAIVQSQSRQNSRPTGQVGGASRYMVLYPRKALAQDQIARVLRYALRTREHYGLTDEDLVIGFQIGGIRSRLEGTANNINNDRVFERVGNHYEFINLDECPWCRQETRLVLVHTDLKDQHPHYLRCRECRQQVRVSLSKSSHGGKFGPHLMVTTAESLDRMYLDPSFRTYLPGLMGVAIDEAHIFHGLYGAHVSHLLRRIAQLVRDEGGRRALAYVASSATVSMPTEFAARLFYCDEAAADRVTWINGASYPAELSNIESLYFLQSPDVPHAPRPASTLIQTIMAVGHAASTGDHRLLTFIDSLGTAARIRHQVVDAEQKRLWSFRMDLQDPGVVFGDACPRSEPSQCHGLYEKGECWRPLLRGWRCHQADDPLRLGPLSVEVISSQTVGHRLPTQQVVIGTSTLEVGIDDEDITAIVQYRPPRTVFDFIQRRGRAGRVDGSHSYSALVLGTEPTDYFYLIRRHRLIDNGRFELPLNPDNPVVCRIHDAYAAARHDLFAAIDHRRSGMRSGVLMGLWDWALGQLLRCAHIEVAHGARLRQIRVLPDVGDRRREVAEWIKQNKREYVERLWAMQGLTRQTERIVTPSLRRIMDGLSTLQEQWRGMTFDNNVTMYQNGLRGLRGQLSKVVMDPPAKRSANFVDEMADVVRALDAMEQLINASSAGTQAELEATDYAWYDFFRHLALQLLGDYQLNSTPDVVKAILQALYRLHRSLDPENAQGCAGAVLDSPPNAYFDDVDSLSVELVNDRYRDREFDEPVTFLDTLFAPFRTEFRYDPDQLTTLALEPLNFPNQPADSRNFRALTRGINMQLRDVRGQVRNARRVTGVAVQQIDTDDEQNVGFCRGCYKLHHASRAGDTCDCGGMILAGGVFAGQVHADHQFIETVRGGAERILRQFKYLPSLTTSSLLRGSRVEFRPASARNDPSQVIRFNAWLTPPLYYDFHTPGIRWHVPGVDLSGGGFNREQVLWSAARVLHRTMAAVSGVREDQLAAAPDIDNDAVVVWERIEGGAGLCETFRNALVGDPIDVYREMVHVVACPIYLAERKAAVWPSGRQQLAAYLSEHFGLPTDDVCVQEIVDETEDESRYPDQDPVCSDSANDGCPACVKAGRGGIGGDEPRRSLAWTAVSACVNTVQYDTGSNEAEIVTHDDAASRTRHVLAF